MPFDLLSLQYKRVRNIDGEDIIDLTESSFKIDNQTRIEDVHKVDAATAGKIWLVSHLYYGSSDYTDILCFYNGISNPFSLKEGDYLLIPNLEDALSNMKDNNKTPEIKTDSSDKLPLIDKRRVSKAVKEDGSQALQPNETNEESIEVKDGKIIFGGNVTDAECLDGTESVAQLRSKIIKNKLKTQLRDGSN